MRLGLENLDVGVRVDFPWQRSEARGRALTARTRLAQIDAELRFLRDRIAVAVRSAWTDMARDYAVYRQVRQEVDLNRELAAGERDRLELGTSTVFMVNLREQAAFEAELKALAALLDYFQSLAEFRAAIGLGQLDDRP